MSTFGPFTGSTVTFSTITYSLITCSTFACSTFNCSTFTCSTLTCSTFTCSMFTYITFTYSTCTYGTFTCSTFTCSMCTYSMFTCSTFTCSTQTPPRRDNVLSFVPLLTRWEESFRLSDTVFIRVCRSVRRTKCFSRDLNLGVAVVANASSRLVPTYQTQRRRTEANQG